MADRHLTTTRRGFLATTAGLGTIGIGWLAAPRAPHLLAGRPRVSEALDAIPQQLWRELRAKNGAVTTAAVSILRALSEKEGPHGNALFKRGVETLSGEAWSVTRESKYRAYQIGRDKAIRLIKVDDQKDDRVVALSALGGAIAHVLVLEHIHREDPTRSLNSTLTHDDERVANLVGEYVQKLMAGRGSKGHLDSWHRATADKFRTEAPVIDELTRIIASPMFPTMTFPARDERWQLPGEKERARTETVKRASEIMRRLEFLDARAGILEF